MVRPALTLIPHLSSADLEAAGRKSQDVLGDDRPVQVGTRLTKETYTSVCLP